MPQFCAPVTFTVHHEFDAPADRLWRELVDWEGHAAWIPMTTMDVPAGDPTAIGYEFTASTGVGPLQLRDHMRVVRCEWDGERGECEVDKLGPVLTGRAAFTVEPLGADRSAIVWVEDVEVPWVPSFLGPIVARFGALGFRQGMKGLAKLL